MGKMTYLTSRNILYASSLAASASAPSIVTSLRKEYAKVLDEGQMAIATNASVEVAKRESSGAATSSVYFSDLQNGATTVSNRFSMSYRVVARSMSEQLAKGLPLDAAWREATAEIVYNNSSETLQTLEFQYLKRPHDSTGKLIGKTFAQIQEIAKSTEDKSLAKLAADRVKFVLQLIRDAEIGAAAKNVRRFVQNGAGRALGLGTFVVRTDAKFLAALGPVAATALTLSDLSGDTPFDPEICMMPGTNRDSDLIAGSSAGLRVRDVINIGFERGCYPKKPMISADSRVFMFFALDEPEKEKAMKNPQVCDFYKKLHANNCAQSVVIEPKCHADEKSLNVILYNKEKRQRYPATIAFDGKGQISAIKGSNFNGYKRVGESWIPYAVPVKKRKVMANIETPEQDWVAYDPKSNPLQGRQKRVFDLFEKSNGWELVSNLGEIEAEVARCFSGKDSTTNVSPAEGTL